MALPGQVHEVKFPLHWDLLKVLLGICTKI